MPHAKQVLNQAKDIIPAQETTNLNQLLASKSTWTTVIRRDDE
jgi:hypothetical protein